MTKLDFELSKKCPLVTDFGKEQLISRLLDPTVLMNETPKIENMDKMGHGSTRKALIDCKLEVTGKLSERCFKKDLDSIQKCFSNNGNKSEGIKYLKDDDLKSFDAPPGAATIKQLDKTFVFLGKKHSCKERLDYAMSTDHMIYRGGGDCEDFSILLASILKYLGYSENKIRLAVGHQKKNPYQGHVWLEIDLSEIQQEKNCLPQKS